MKNIQSTKVALLVALSLSALLLAGCGQKEASPPPATKQAVEPSPSALAAEKKDAHGDEHGGAEPIKLTAEEIRSGGITVTELHEQEIGEQLTVTATIRPNQERIAHVAPRVPGRIVKVSARLGEQIKAGQTLAVLDSLEVGEAHSAYLQAKTQLAVTRADFERAEKLHGDQIIAQKDHLRAHSEYEKAKASFAAAGDKLRMLGVDASPTTTGPAISTFALTTPFAGTVIEKHAILGELAQPDKELFVVADLSTMWIEANLFEKDIRRVKVGADATVVVAAYPDETFRGRVTYIAAFLDKETRTVQARVEISNADGRLKPEMFATVAISAKTMLATEGTAKALQVPTAAIVLIDGTPTVFVEDDDGFEPRTVVLGEKLRERVVIKDGLVAGDRVVTAGAYGIKARIMKSQLGEGHGH